MCGIAGAIGPRVRIESVAAMSGAMAHRGPDDHGLHSEEGVVLAMRRLSILDLSPDAHQPMTNERGDVWLVFNGEIYNYRALNNDLKSRGYRIRSSGDTETLLHLYEEHGPSFIERLEGMFALAVWDRRAGTLLLGRDRLGIKPLYYSCTADGLLFASEIKALLESGEVPRTVDPAALYSYLHTGSVVGPRTLIGPISALPPGSSVTVTRSNWRQSPITYWQPRFSGSVTDPAAAVAGVRRSVISAVRDHLISDVGVGVFLSGGVDSTLVAAIAAQEAGRMNSYSVGYELGGSRFDETPIAERVAQHLGLDHYTQIVSTNDIVNILPAFIRALDQPTHDGINVYLAAQLASRHGKVVLSGLGADELFGGYSTFRFAALLQRLTPLAPFGSASRPLVDAAHSRLPQRFTSQWFWRVARSMSRSGRDPVVDYWTVREMYDVRHLERLLAPDLVDSAAAVLYSQAGDAIASSAASTPVGRVLILELTNYLRNTLLPDADAMSMAHSIELRVPFLDRRLVDFVLSLGDVKPRNRLLLNKRLLLTAFDDLIPEWVASRPKQGFAVPLPIWLRRPEIRAIVEECLSRGAITDRGLLTPEVVQDDLKSFYSDESNWGNQGHLWLRIWMLVVLELWFRTHIDRGSACSAAAVH